MASREHYRRNRERVLAQARAYRVSHLEQERAADRAYALANRERKRDASRAWRAANRERMVLAQRARYAANPEKYRAMGLAYRTTHRAERVHAVVLLRAKKVGSQGTHTLQEWREKCALFANLCAYCGEAKPLTRDHNVPLVRGGRNDIANIVPACKSCNSLKHIRTASEFIAAAQVPSR